METNHRQLVELSDKVYDFCSGYSKNPGRGYRMVIFGNNGSGKSHTARKVNAWASRMAINLPLVHSETGYKLAESKFYNWPEVVKRMKGGDWDIIDEMIPPELLVIDDLGAENDPSKMGIEHLYLILERREYRWTVITTNVSPENWESRFEKRIASRFLRNCKHVSLDQVPDYNE